MQYDFNLAANAAIAMQLSGKFFKYKSGTGPIRVKATKGGYIDLLPGQGVYDIDFNDLSILDISGAQNKGVILAGYDDFRDDRIAGAVEVIDGERTRTMAGSMFGGAPYCGAVAGQYSNLQLWNPAGSGKNLIVTAMDCGTTASGGGINVLLATVMLANAFALAPANKKIGGMVSVATLRNENKAAAESFLYGSLRNESTVAGVPFVWNIKGAILVVPGSGLNVYCPTVNFTSTANFEWFEEAI